MVQLAMIMTSDYTLKKKELFFLHKVSFNSTAYLSHFIFYDILSKINSKIHRNKITSHELLFFLR